VLYIITLRIAFNAGQKLRKKQFEIWENLTLEYLSGEVSSEEIGKAVKTKYFNLFAEFMEKYLETLKGKDFQNLTHLLKEMGLFDYNLKRLGSRKRWHRVYAAFFLGLLRDKEAVPGLQKGLKDKDYLMSFACATALAKIGEKQHLKETLSLLTRREDLGPDKAAEVLLEFGNGICSELVSILNRVNIDSKWKYLIIDLLGYWQYLESGPTLLKLLNASKDSQMKIRSIKALGEMSYLESAPALAAHLDDENWHMRSEAARALGKIGASEYSDKMLKSLADKDWWVRYNAARALANFGEEGIALLKKMTKQEKDSDTRDISIHILSEIELLGGEVR
jgi:HEAT repeat protein